MNYGYGVMIKETYQRDPSCWCHLNTQVSKQYAELDEVFCEIKRETIEINNRFTFIKQWTRSEGGTVTHKVMFEKPGKVGRFIRSFIVTRNKKPDFSVNDSLI